MLTAIRSADGKKVHAKASQRVQGPYFCPSCLHELRLAKGLVRIHHFRHQPEERLCPWRFGETSEHYDCKAQIFDALSASTDVSYAELECRIGLNIADVYAVIRGVKVAIEVQRSFLTVDAITARTVSYHREGVFVLWLSLLTEDACLSEYSPSVWERWCHAAYGGRVYYWVKGATVQPIHYGPHLLRVPETTWVGRDRVEHTGGGYERVSKRYRNPMHGQRVEITTGFAPRKRAPWEGGTVQVPRCSLYLDTQPTWWAPRAAAVGEGV